MAAQQFTSAEWKKITEVLSQNRAKYGLPEREYGSVLLGSFNIRKLGSSRSRNQDTWEFLAEVCRSFDLLAVQEIMDCWQSAQVGQIRTREDYYYEELRGSSLRVLL